MIKIKNLVIAYSGGKDSTALVLRFYEKGQPFRLLYTPTGNELPGVVKHIRKIAKITNSKIINLKSPKLLQLIKEQRCLPNWRMRWCTRMIKIEPCLDWLRNNENITLAVGLRYDENTREGGLYGGSANIIYPLRDWHWGINDVLDCVNKYKISIPERTDCAWCFYQTLLEWQQLWQNYPYLYKEASDLEVELGHTFRSPTKDKWPHELKVLAYKFEQGWIPKTRKKKRMCRLCSL